MVPGIGPSADTGELKGFAWRNATVNVFNTPAVLQARIFSYPDAARYRLGVNYQQLPPNRSVNPIYSPYERDGHGTINGNYGGDPDYVRSGFQPMSLSRRHRVPTHEAWSGKVVPFATEVSPKDFVQPRELWHIICQEPNGKREFLENIVPSLVQISPHLRGRVFGKIPVLLFCIWAFGY